MGASGSGKTTLLNILGGLDETEETFTVRYDVDYIPDENSVLLSITIEGTVQNWFPEIKYMLSVTA